MLDWFLDFFRRLALDYSAEVLFFSAVFALVALRLVQLFAAPFTRGYSHYAALKKLSGALSESGKFDRFTLASFEEHIALLPLAARREWVSYRDGAADRPSFSAGSFFGGSRSLIASLLEILSGAVLALAGALLAGRYALGIDPLFSSFDLFMLLFALLFIYLILFYLKLCVYHSYLLRRERQFYRFTGLAAEVLSRKALESVFKDAPICEDARLACDADPERSETSADRLIKEIAATDYSELGEAQLQKLCLLLENEKSITKDPPARRRINDELARIVKYM